MVGKEARAYLATFGSKASSKGLVEFKGMGTENVNGNCCRQFSKQQRVKDLCI